MNKNSIAAQTVSCIKMLENSEIASCLAMTHETKIKASLRVASRPKQSRKKTMLQLFSPKIALLFVSTFLFFSFTTIAQTITNFTLLDVVSVDTVSLKQYANKKGVAVIFTSNECAFDNYYSERIKKLANTYSDNIQFLLINASQEPGEAVAAMNQTIAQRRINVPYLADKAQVALTMLDAKKTPEVFLLKPTAGKFTVFYAGALDDNPQVATDVKQDYLKNNIEKLLAGQPSDESVRAVGCSVRRR